MSTKEVTEYLNRKNVPELMEALMAGIMFEQPDDPVQYIEKCLEKLRQAKEQGKPETNWDTFINQFQKSTVQARKVTTRENESINAVFVLGGPGSGKGTQCSKLVEEFGVGHVSVGDLLREEVASGSEIGQTASQLMKDGKMVPLDIVLQILRQKLEAEFQKRGQDEFILIDGFPREMGQVFEFEKQIGKVKGVLFFDCSEEQMEKRLLKRGETSGRADDNAETIRKRFKTFQEQSMPVIEHYRKIGNLMQITSEGTVDDVYAATKGKFVSMKDQQ